MDENGLVYADGCVATRKRFNWVKYYFLKTLCWVIDALTVAVGYIVGGIIVVVMSAIAFVLNLLWNIVLYIAAFFLSVWVIGALCYVAWMIWGPKNL